MDSLAMACEKDEIIIKAELIWLCVPMCVGIVSFKPPASDSLETNLLKNCGHNTVRDAVSYNSYFFLYNFLLRSIRIHIDVIA